jgi:hypothetical protein
LEADDATTLYARHRTPDALEVELTHRFDGHSFIDSQQNTAADQDLAGLSFVAKPGRDI